MTAFKFGRASPVRDSVLKQLSQAPKTALELANGAGTTVNCIQVSLGRWLEEQLVKVSGDATTRPRRYALGDKAPDRMPFVAAEERAAQVSIAEKPAKPDPHAVNREKADRDWLRAQEAAVPRKPGDPESVAEFEARGGRVEKLPGCGYVPPTLRPVGWKS